MMASIRVTINYIYELLVATWLWLHRTLFPAGSALSFRSNARVVELPVTSPFATPQFASGDRFVWNGGATYCHFQSSNENVASGELPPRQDIMQCELTREIYSQRRTSHEFFRDDYLCDADALEDDYPHSLSVPLQAPIIHGMASSFTLDQISSRFTPSCCSTPPSRRVSGSCDSSSSTRVEHAGSPRRPVDARTDARIGPLGQRRGFKGAPLLTSSTTSQVPPLALPSAKSDRSSGQMSPTPRTPLSSIANLCASWSPKSTRSSKRAPLQCQENYDKDDPFAINAPSFYVSISADSTLPWNDYDLTMYSDPTEHQISLRKGCNRPPGNVHAHSLPGPVMKTTIYDVSAATTISHFEATSEVPKPGSLLLVPPSDVDVVLTPPSPPTQAGRPSLVLLPESLKFQIETGTSFVDDDPFGGPQAPPKSVVSADAGDLFVSFARQKRSCISLVSKVRGPRKVTSELTDPTKKLVVDYLDENPLLTEGSLVTPILGTGTRSIKTEREHRKTLNIIISSKGLESSTVDDQSQLCFPRHSHSITKRGNPQCAPPYSEQREDEAARQVTFSPMVSGVKFDHDSNRFSPSSTGAAISTFPGSLDSDIFEQNNLLGNGASSSLLPTTAKFDATIPTARRSMSTMNVDLKTSAGDTVAGGTSKKKRRSSAPSAFGSWLSSSQQVDDRASDIKSTRRRSPMRPLLLSMQVAMRETTNPPDPKSMSGTDVAARPVSWLRAQSGQNRVKVKIIPPTPVLKGPKTFSLALDHSLLVVVDPDDDAAETSADYVDSDGARQSWSKSLAELIAIVNTFDFKTGAEKAQRDILPKSPSEGSISTREKRDSLTFFRSSIK